LAPVLQPHRSIRALLLSRQGLHSGIAKIAGTLSLQPLTEALLCTCFGQHRLLELTFKGDIESSDMPS